MRPIYLDYAATTPVDPRVFNAMRPYFSEKFGNPGSVHSLGQEAMAAIDEAREKIAKAIDAQFREIIFTASATESNNLAFCGTVRNFWWHFFKEHGRKTSSLSTVPHIITSAIEHESVLETLHDMEKRGAAQVTILPVDRYGVVNLKKLKAALNERTVLVSVMYASNEVGTIEPITEIGEIIKTFRDAKEKSSSTSHYPLVANHYPLFHTDAVQAFQYLNCDVNSLGVDLMTLSSHKIYGPKGVGALYVRRGGLTTNHYPLATIISGGGQEYGLRSGTENVPSIMGFGKAAELLSSYPKEAERVTELREHFWAKLKKMRPKLELNGPKIGDKALSRLPNNLNVYFPNITAEELLIKLDMAGIEASAGSACAARSLQPSYVIKELGFSEKRARSSLRFSLGRQTTLKDIDKVLLRVKNIFTRLNF